MSINLLSAAVVIGASMVNCIHISKDNSLPTGKFCILYCSLIFIKLVFFEKNYGSTFRMSNILDPDQAGSLVRPGLDPNC